MSSTIYQLTLIIGMGTLITLLIRGMSLGIALYRSVVVIMAMLGLLLVAGIIVKWATIPKPQQSESEINDSETDLEVADRTE